MEKKDEFFLYCLNKGVRSEKVEWDDKYKDVDFKEIIKLASEHDVTSLVYNSLVNTVYMREKIEMVEAFRNRAMFSNIYQIKANKKTQEIIKKINESNIDVMIMKGMILRKYYPRAEFRTMGDVDILIKSSDIEKVKDIVRKEEWDLGIDGEIHFEVSYKQMARIEVHKKIKEFELNILEEDIDIKDEFVCRLGENLYKLKDEKFLLHLALHMLKHMNGSGFGIRQILDFNLFVKNNCDMNWDEFDKDIKKMKIERFIAIIFTICNKTFGLEIPKIILEKNINIPSEYLEVFMNSIIQSGVHGQAYKFKGAVKGSKGKILFLTDELNNRYSYAKKYKILLVVAWIHRVLTAIFIFKCTFKDFYSMVTVTKKQVKKEEKLDLWLEGNE